MKIAFTTDSIRDNLTGVGIYTKGLINAFLKYFSNIKYIFIDYKRTFFNKNKLLLLNNFFITSKMSLWFNYVALASNKFDFNFIFNCTGTPHFVPFKQKEIFVVHDLHTILYPKFTSKKTFIYNKLFLRKSLNQSYKIIVNSNQTREELIRFFNIKEDKIFKIYVPLLENKNISKENNLSKPFILNISTLDIRKNIINLIIAYEYLKREKKIPHKLLLVGKKGFGASKIYNYINRSKYRHDILLKGYVKEKDKINLIKNASLCTYLSFYEGLGIPVFEAAYYKCPILATKNPIINEIFKDSMVINNANDPYEIANKIFAILNTNNNSLILSNYQKAQNISSKKFIKSQLNKLKKFLLF